MGRAEGDGAFANTPRSRDSTADAVQKLRMVNDCQVRSHDRETDGSSLPQIIRILPGCTMVQVAIGVGSLPSPQFYYVEKPIPKRRKPQTNSTEEVDRSRMSSQGWSCVGWSKHNTEEQSSDRAFSPHVKQLKVMRRH